MTLESVVDSQPSSAAKGSALSVRVRDDGVAVVTYDVPGEPVNTLKASFSKEFDAMLVEIESNPRVNAAVLISGKPDSVHCRRRHRDAQGRQDRARCRSALSRRARHASVDSAASKKPIVAAVHGAALGGGFEVALACRAPRSLRRQEDGARLPRGAARNSPGLNGLQRLAAQGGLQVALDYGLTGKNMRASKAKQLGSRRRSGLQGHPRETSRSCSPRARCRGRPGDAQEEGRQELAVAAEIATRRAREEPGGPGDPLQEGARDDREEDPRALPGAACASSTCSRNSRSDGLEASKEAEAKAFGELAVSPVCAPLDRDLLRAHRAEEGHRRRRSRGEAARFEKVFVLGAGLMGAGIAYVTSAIADTHVRMKDRDDAVGRAAASSTSPTSSTSA